MARLKIDNIEGTFYNVLLETKIQDFISSLKWIAGNNNNCSVTIYLDESLDLSSSILKEADYIQGISNSFLKSHEKYINFKNQLYFSSKNFPADIENYIPSDFSSSIWSPIIILDQCHGFIAVHLNENEISDNLLNTLSSVLNLFSQFLTLNFLYLNNNKVNINEVLDNLGTYFYILNKHTFEIIYASNGLKNKFKNIGHNSLTCYQTLFNKNNPCSFCPINKTVFDFNINKPVEFNLPNNDWYRISAKPYQNSDDFVIVALNDITELKQRELSIEKIAYWDQHLNINNRAAFSKELLKLVNLKTDSVYAIMIDIEDFKQLNDLFGFEIGNNILKIIVEELKNINVINNSYRFSGGQFCVLLPKSDVLKAVEIVRDFLARFEGGITIGEKKINLKLNTAIISNKESEFLLDNFISKMEYAVEEVKNSSSNFLILGKPMEEKMRRINIIKQVIKNTIDNGNIIVVYQPIFNLKTNSFNKAEALARIYDEELGWISPAEFIPIAEKMGRIHELNMMILDRICKQMGEMRKEGIRFSNVHINISVAQLHELNFVEQILSVIDKHRIPHNEIELEITESSDFSSLEVGENLINNFLKHGIHTSLDDFGTGYSSLDYVINLPFRTLKIDAGLIQHIVENEKFLKMVKYIIRIAQDFDMITIAEGVESYEQYCILEELGCDNIQGYYFAKPMLKDQIIKRKLTSYNYTKS